jgi:phospholipid/cholesterol/gamma-HCH transport system permease protein
MASEAAQSENLESPAAAAVASRFSGVIALWTGTLTFLGESALLTGQTLRWIVRGGIDVRDLVTQMALIGADSIWIVLVITAATGAVFALYTTSLALKIGFTQFVGGTMSYGFLNELGPVLGGVAFASRSGAAIAAEIGSMVVTEQVDALRAMAIAPVRYLVVPRVLASVIMLPLLTVIADVAGLYGGYFFAVAKGVPAQAFWDSVRTYTLTADLFNGLLKSVVFGFLVGIIACQQGLRTKGGATGVGKATTSSVVLCVVMIFIADFFMAQILTARDTSRQASAKPLNRRLASARPLFDPALGLAIRTPAETRWPSVRQQSYGSR